VRTENDGCRLGSLRVGPGHDGLPGGTWGPRTIGIISTSSKDVEVSILVLLPSPPLFLSKKKKNLSPLVLSPNHTIYFFFFANGLCLFDDDALGVPK